MHFSLITLLVILCVHISLVYTQGIPQSPCPKIFQYRFDGAEWFGQLSVPNTDMGAALHIKVTLSIRGKPTTNYLGEIELLTRGQYESRAPVRYKIKFPKTHSMPKLMQISVNKRIICQGTADHSFFVTQIQLEHTRKYTFIGDGTVPGEQQSQQSQQQTLPRPPTLDQLIAHNIPIHNDESGNIDVNNDYDDADDDDVSVNHVDDINFVHASEQFNMKKHLPSAQPKSKMTAQAIQRICGQVDERIRLQLLRTQRTAGSHAPAAESDGTDVESENGASTALSAAARKLPIILPAGIFDQSGIEAGAGVDVDGSSSSSSSSSGSSSSSSSSSGSSSLAAANHDDLAAITRGAWPWLAAVYVNNLTALAYQCGGTLVTARIVITSAHCFHMLQQRYSANEVLIFLGRHNLRNWSEEGSVAASVDDIFLHPDFDAQLHDYDADIAVVVLKHEIKFNRYIRPACLWTGVGSNQLQYIVGEQGKVVGWGLATISNNMTSTIQHSTAAIARMMDAPIVSNELCFAAQPKLAALSSNRTFCAGNVVTPSLHIHMGPCAGDSGTGLLLYRNKRWFLRGIVSATLPNKLNKCNVNQYVIYADVAKFLDWILAFTI